MAALLPELQAQPANANPPPAQSTNATPYKNLSLEELMNLDVTSVAKTPEPYGEAAAALQVLTGEDIRRSGATTITEALRLADNLDVAQVSSTKWDISARGFNSSVGNKLLVLMDGRSVYSPLYSGVIWNNQDYLLQDVERIEVISGPGGTLWGANAVNGVINITSKSAQDTQGLYLEAGGGTGTQDFEGVRYGSTLASNVYFRVYGKYFDQDAEVYANGNSAQDPWNHGQGGFRIDSDAAPENHLTFQGDIYAGNADTAGASEGTTGGGNLLTRWTHTFINDNNLSLQVYFDRTHLGGPEPGDAKYVVDAADIYPAIPAGYLTEDLDTYDVDFQNQIHLGKWQRLTWGLGYRFTHDAVGNSPLIGFSPATLDQNLYNSFVQDEITLHEKLILTLGCKVEHNDYTGFEDEPSGRLQWNFDDHQMLWGAISKAVRTPSRYDEDLQFPYSPYVYRLVGNPEFRSESVIAYELGYRGQLTSKVTTSFSTFYNDYDHLRSEGLAFYHPTAVYPAPLFDVTWENNLEAHTYGFEYSGDYQALPWWRLHAGYDLLKEDIFLRPHTTDLNGGLDETADPQQQVMLRSSMDLPHRIEFNVAGRWIDTVHNNSGSTPGTVPSYGEMDVRIAWHATDRVEFSIVGQNLLHDHHPEAGFPSPTREEITRNVFGKVSYLW